MNAPLATTYLGIQLRSPVIVGSCPYNLQPESVRQFVGAGAGAIVLPSMLQEQLVHAELKSTDGINAISRSGYQPQQDQYNGGVEGYLDAIVELKELESVPIFASLNGASPGPWLDYAKQIEQSGADGLELNWQSIITNPDETTEEVERPLLDIVRRLRAIVSLPIAVKVNQRFTNLASIAHKVQEAGADGLVLFAHAPAWDVSIDRMHWTVRWELSPIHYLGQILEGIVRTRAGGIDISIAASGGVRTSEDALKAMIAGADVVMVTSEIYRTGPEAVQRIVEGINRFLNTSHYASLQEFQKARPPIELGPERLMRMEYVDPLTSVERYMDPTPAVPAHSGDSYGHASGLGSS